jgi:hypothetical protein
VVVAASDSAKAIARTLSSLGLQSGAGDLEVIVAAACDRMPARWPAADDMPFHGLHQVIAPPGTGVPRLRRLGFDRATAPIVVFTEDSCRFGPGWAEAWIAAFRVPGLAAATGPVEASMGHALVDWAVFFCEYAPFLPLPRTAGRSSRLAGNNFAVRRAVVERLAGPEIHETEVAQDQLQAGRRGREGFVVVEAAQAGHVRRYAPAAAIGDRLRFGYAYGRLRAGPWPPSVRLAGIFGGPAILAVQAARLTATVLARRRHLGRFLEALPVTLALLTAWSVGEWLGWLGAPVPVQASPRRSWAAGRRRERAARPAAPPPARGPARSGRYTGVPPAA